MKSCQDYLSELRQKIQIAEDHLRSEKKNLYKAQELFIEDKEKWTAAIRGDELKIHSNDIQIKEKEAQLDLLKNNYAEVQKKCARLEAENHKIKRDLQKMKTQREDEMNKFLLEKGNLEKELSKVRDFQKELKLTNKWTRAFKDKELRAAEAENESSLQSELKQLTDEFAKKIEAFDESLRDIDSASLRPKKERLAALQEALDRVTTECKTYEEKNKALENQIQLLDKA